MSEWVERRLGDCVDVLDNLRVPVNGEQRSAEPGATPYYGANGLQGYINGYIFDEPLILIAEDGGYFDEFAQRPIAYRISGRSWVNNHAHVLRPKIEFDFDFLFYSLQHKNIVAFIKGGTRAKLNQAELRDIKVAAPQCKSTQQKIATILSTIDTAIEQTEALIEKYQHIKAGLMHDLFTRGVLLNGQLRPPREQAPDLYQETAIGWIPNDWVFTTCDVVCEQIIDCKNRTPPETPDGHPVIRTPNVRHGEFVDKELLFTAAHSYAIWTARGKPKVGDVVITREAPVGEVCMIPERHPEACLGQRMMLYRPNKNLIDPDFFLFALQSRQIQNRLDLISGGSTVGHVRVGDIRSLWMFMPKAKHEQHEIAKTLSQATERIRSEQARRNKLQTQKLGLMQDLLTGKVPVRAEPEPEALEATGG